MSGLAIRGGFLARSWKRFSDILLGPALLRRPSERIMRAIRGEEDKSEILVSWVQIGAIVFFATFYAVSPKAFSPDVPFEPVPATLSTYAVFTAARLILAYRGRLRPWFLALSVIVDIAVLMITIWSYHLQYQQPPTIYLKAPTLLYVFILIALRALRFDARWVLLAGLSAAVGWLMLLFYALHGTAMGAVLTHSYVEYATSLKLLVGAEVDKIVSILMVTAVLALALERGRRLLVRSVADEAAAAELSRFFAAEIAATIVESGDTIRPGVGMERKVSAMFIDLRGFTGLSSVMEPSSVVAMLGEYQAVVVPIVRRHGGGIMTYLGDGIMAAFGATRDSASCAADALRATEELVVALSRWAQQRRTKGLPAPESGIGVAWGAAICGAIGTEDRLEYAVIGDPVNRAAKLQALTKTVNARAFVAAPAWAAAIEQGFRPVRPHWRQSDCILPGITDPVEAVALS
jgi:adenylate cyclase